MRVSLPHLHITQDIPPLPLSLHTNIPTHTINYNHYSLSRYGNTYWDSVSQCQLPPRARPREGAEFYSGSLARAWARVHQARIMRARVCVFFQFFNCLIMNTSSLDIKRLNLAAMDAAINQLSTNFLLFLRG